MTSLDVLQRLVFESEDRRGLHDAMTVHHSYDVEKLSLVMSEVVEALEEIRAGRAPDEDYFSCPQCKQVLDEPGIHNEFVTDGGTEFVCSNTTVFKPEGVGAEMADVIIRSLDYLASRRISAQRVVDMKMAYNETRPRLNGKKF